MDEFERGPWSRKFPTVVAAWRRAWDRVIPFFAFPPAVRRVLYTNNAIESVHARLRKIIKSRDDRNRHVLVLENDSEADPTRGLVPAIPVLNPGRETDELRDENRFTFGKGSPHDEAETAQQQPPDIGVKKEPSWLPQEPLLRPSESSKTELQSRAPQRQPFVTGRPGARTQTKYPEIKKADQADRSLNRTGGARPDERATQEVLRQSFAEKSGEPPQPGQPMNTGAKAFQDALKRDQGD